MADFEEAMASRERRIETYAGRFVALEDQLSTLQHESRKAQLEHARRREADDRSTVALFVHFQARFDDQELDDPRLLAIGQRAAASPDAPATAYAVREALPWLLRSWETEMADTPVRLSEFKRLWLDSLDKQIAELELHKRALQLLDELDKDDWYRVKFGRRALNGAQTKLTQHAERALQAIHTARMVLDCHARPEAAFASIDLAYKLVRATRDYEYYDMVSFGASDVDCDISRVACAIQVKIDELVASGERYAIKCSDAPPPEGALKWAMTILEPEMATDYDDADDHSAPVLFEQSSYSFEPEPFNVNPANGMPMNGGMSGLDIYGNTYGSDLNDPW